MAKKRLKTIGTTLLTLIIALACFYTFMTYDRVYTWSKQYQSDIIRITEPYGFHILSVEEIPTNTIKLPAERAVKIRIQKALSKVNLMQYGHAFGESLTLASDSSAGRLYCKAWRLDDHVIVVEIAYSHVPAATLDRLKQDFTNTFANYELVWTRLAD